jgi:hypothetical protein
MLLGHWLQSMPEDSWGQAAGSNMLQQSTSNERVTQTDGCALPKGIASESVSYHR